MIAEVARTLYDYFLFHIATSSRANNMTKQELDIFLDKLGLKVPETERDELVTAAYYIEKMAASIKKPLLNTTESAHVVSFPKGNS